MARLLVGPGRRGGFHFCFCRKFGGTPIHRVTIGYTPLLWSTVFPLGMYATATFRLSVIASASALNSLSVVLTVVQKLLNVMMNWSSSNIYTEVTLSPRALVVVVGRFRARISLHKALPPVRAVV